MNKKAESQLGTIIVIAVIIGLLAHVFGVITIPGLGGTGTTEDETTDSLTDESTKNCPTTGITTYTINVQDELTASATNVDSEYYIFNGQKLIKEGTTGSDGTVDVDVTCGKDYKLLLLNTTSGSGNGLYSKTFDLQARTSADTFNAELVKFGEAKILGIENPADPARNANVSIVAGQTKNFDLKFSANKTERGYNRPLILCEAAVSNISSIDIGSFSDGTSVVDVTALPKRVTPTATQQYYAWEYPKMLSPSMGVVTASGTITAASSVNPSTVEDMSCKIADQATWKTSSYKTATSIDEGFKTSAENAETLADVGGVDSSIVSYTFVNAGGY